MGTLNKLTGDEWNDLPLFAVDTPVNLSASQDVETANKTHDTCGRGYAQLLAHYDPITQSWKTSEATSGSDSTPCLQTLPVSGMTQNGRLYQLPRWVPRTLENGSLLWPTLSANGMGNTGSQQMLQSLVNAGHLTEDEKRGMTAGNGGRINPTWAEWFMGFPTGWTDLEA